MKLATLLLTAIVFYLLFQSDKSEPKAESKQHKKSLAVTPLTKARPKSKKQKAAEQRRREKVGSNQYTCLIIWWSIIYRSADCVYSCTFIPCNIACVVIIVMNHV